MFGILDMLLGFRNSEEMKILNKIDELETDERMKMFDKFEMSKKLNQLLKLDDSEKLEVLEQMSSLEEKDKLDIIDMLKNLEKGEKNKLKQKNKLKKFLFFILFFYFIMIIYTLFSSQGADYVNRKSVDKTITQAINNNSNISVLKSISEEFPVRKKNIINKVFNKWEEESHYDAPLSLNKVLESLRNENYKSEKFNLELDEKLNKLIVENQQVNPFDNLELYQREYFTNIKIKLEENQYKKINNDINKIITDLSDKNKLTTLYLDKSNMSFYISLIAFMITLIPACYGGYQFFIKFKNKFSSKID